MTTSWTTNVFYKLEPLSVYIVNIAGGAVDISNVTIDGNSLPFSARHTTAGTTMTIDLTELAKIAKSSFSLRLTDSSGSKTLTASWAGDADPANFLPPTAAGAQEIEPYLDDPLFNMPPPSMMIGGGGIITEAIYSEHDAMDNIKYIDDVTTTGKINSIKVTADAPYISYDINAASPVIVRRMTPQQCGVRYCSVEWLSRTGVTLKRHNWEVIKVTESELDPQDIQRIDRQWDVRKGRLVTVTLRLEGLDAYDVWYYSDIVTSSLIRMDNDAGRAFGINVTTKSVTIPDGDVGAKNTLEIEAQYIRYEI